MTCLKTLFLALINRLQSNKQLVPPFLGSDILRAVKSMFCEFEKEKYRRKYHNFMLANQRNYCTANLFDFAVEKRCLDASNENGKL